MKSVSCKIPSAPIRTKPGPRQITVVPSGCVSPSVVSVCFPLALLLSYCRAAALFLPRGLCLDVHRGHSFVPNRGWRHLQQRLLTPELLHLWLWKPGSGGGHLSNARLQVLRHRQSVRFPITRENKVTLTVKGRWVKTVSVTWSCVCIPGAG